MTEYRASFNKKQSFSAARKLSFSTRRKLSNSRKDMKQEVYIFSLKQEAR